MLKRARWSNHLVVRRPGVIARQKWEPVFGDHGFLVVLCLDGANVIERLPQNDGDEFDFISNRSAQQVAAAKSFFWLSPGRSSASGVIRKYQRARVS